MVDHIKQNNDIRTPKMAEDELYKVAKELVNSYNKSDSYFAFYAGQLSRALDNYMKSILPK